MSKKRNKKKVNGSKKPIDPILAKARSLRSSLLRRVKPEFKEDTPTINELEKWLRRSSYICYYSLEPLTFEQITIDHKVPLNRNGTNKIENLCICSSAMNTAKGSMTEDEFRSLLELIKTWEDGGESIIRRLRQGFFGR